MLTKEQKIIVMGSVSLMSFMVGVMVTYAALAVPVVEEWKFNSYNCMESLRFSQYTLDTCISNFVNDTYDIVVPENPLQEWYDQSQFKR